MANKIEKMTNVKALDYVLANCELTDEVREKVERIKASYEKKSATTGERKPTAKQKENEIIKQALYEAMEDDKAYRVGDMVKEFTHIEGLTSASKVTAMMTQMVADGTVTRSEIKGKAYYTKVAVEG